MKLSCSATRNPQPAIFCLLLIAASFLLPSPAQAVRIKDIARVEGFRTNQLFGYGLVVGLAGTGDKQNTEFTVQTLTSLLQNYNIRVSANDVRVKNVAAVIVTAEVPPYTQPGTRLDVAASSVGDAQSLSGGTLLLTPLKGPDGQVYAVAQGPLSLGGGFTANGVGARISKNHQTVAQVTGGALLERPVAVPELTVENAVHIQLNRPDFTTAQRVAEVINAAALDAAARPRSPGIVAVTVPPGSRQDPVSFFAAIESLEVSPDAPARGVVNERTGTVIMGQEVRIAPVAVAHAGLYITVKTDLGVSQPQPLSRGETVVVPNTTIVLEEPKNRQLVEIPGGNGVLLRELVMALNTLGVTPRDLIAVFEALKQAGALQAELVLM
jgi:flagellar P-ring protein precursor FlgI